MRVHVPAPAEEKASPDGNVLFPQRLVNLVADYVRDPSDWAQARDAFISLFSNMEEDKWVCENVDEALVGISKKKFMGKYGGELPLENLNPECMYYKHRVLEKFRPC